MLILYLPYSCFTTKTCSGCLSVFLFVPYKKVNYQNIACSPGVFVHQITSNLRNLCGEKNNFAALDQFLPCSLTVHTFCFTFVCGSAEMAIEPRCRYIFFFIYWLLVYWSGYMTEGHILQFLCCWILHNNKHSISTTVDHQVPYWIVAHPKLTCI